MSKRLQVVMSLEEYDEIRATAEAARLTVSQWVRQSLRRARSAQGAPPDPLHLAARERTPPYGDLLTRVMERYGLPDPESALRFALRRAADPPLTRQEILSLEGTGWAGDLDALRSTQGPEPLP